MIEFVSGDLFSSGSEALVNAVNTVGVMGGGIAAQFKQKYPEYFLDYKVACKANAVKIGRCYVYVTPLEQPRYIVSLPTKAHWRNASVLADVETALQHLRWVVLGCGIESIAIPALGCGLGGLEWEDVKPLIRECLFDLDCDIKVYEPGGHE